ncbi:hypothetical protein FQA39_LY06826 [Lamprigera yunnana]|nr:hypothetical protein FQA39_LY06826 [Lamprigera yunnana]
MVLITGIGNPLLDVIVNLCDNEVLKKYNLKEDEEKETSIENIKLIIDDLSMLESHFTPGGCVQNTLRLLQWILGKSNTTVMFGCVGKDEQGKILKTLIEASGVQTQYIEHDNEPTGTSLVLISGTSRTLLAHIGAAQQISVEDLQSIKMKTILESSDLIYMEGFFISNRVDVAREIQEHCNTNKILFTFNLSGVYMIEKYPKDILHFARTCDVLVGNRREFKALINYTNINVTVEHFATAISENYSNAKDLPYGKIVVITDGSGPLFCSYSGKTSKTMNVPKIDENKIKDTNGAGDAFVAGFLAALLNKRTPVCCMKWGCWVAQQVMQQIGCCTPPYSAEFLYNIDD